MVQIAYITLAIRTVTHLLDREKWCANAKASLSVRFEQEGGLDKLVSIYRSIFDIACTSVRSPNLASESVDHEAKLRVLQAYGGMRITLGLLEKLSLSRLSEVGPSGRIEDRDSPDYVDVPGFVVRCRSKMLQILLDMWRSEALRAAPPNVVRLVFRTLVNILAGEEEESKIRMPLSPRSPNPFRREAAPSEDRVQQLIDMGFPRGAAVVALHRCANNINTATEFLVSNPHIVSSYASEDSSNTGEGEVGDPVAVSVANMDTDRSSSDQQAEAMFTSHPTTEYSKAALDERRKSIKATFFEEALDLIGVYKQLIFDLRDACQKLNTEFPSEGDAILQPLLKRLESRDLSKVDDENLLTSEVHFLAVLASDHAYRQRLDKVAEQISNLLEPYLEMLLTKGVSESAKNWTASVLLLVENLVTLSEAPAPVVPKRDKKDTSFDIAQVLQGPAYTSLRQKALDVCLHFLDVANNTLTQEDLTSVLRLLLLLSRQDQAAAQIAQPHTFTSLISRLLNADTTDHTQELCIIIMRHVMETPTVLRELMTANVEDWLGRQRGRSIDVTSFLHGMKSTALRDPLLFLDVTASICKLSGATGPTHTQNIVLQKPADTTASSETASSAPQLPPLPLPSPVSSIINHGIPSEQSTRTPQIDNIHSTLQVDCVVHHFLQEIVALNNKGINWSDYSKDHSEATTIVHSANGDTQSSVTAAAIDERYSKELARARFFLACLAELLYSYLPCKASILRFRLSDGSTFLSFLFDQYLPSNTLSADKGKPSVFKSLRIGEFSSLVVVGLCSDLSASHSRSKTPEQLVDVRREVLREVNKSIDSAIRSTESTAARYGRLCSLADLCLSLLSPSGSTASSVSRRSRAGEDYHENIAHLMVEESLAVTLTSALAEIDLNYPTIKTLINHILRPLGHLAKSVKAQGKPNGPSQAIDVEARPILSDSEDESDEGDPGTDAEMDDPPRHANDATEEEGDRDIYRSSALGMFEGALADSNERTEDDDTMMEEDDYGMDEDMGAELAVPSDISDDDEDDDLDEEHHEEHDSGSEPSSSDGSEIEDEDDEMDERSVPSDPSHIHVEVHTFHTCLTR